jgi:hypothetical protein
MEVDPAHALNRELASKVARLIGSVEKQATAIPRVHRVIELDADVGPFHLSFWWSCSGKRAEEQCATYTETHGGRYQRTCPE